MSGQQQRLPLHIDPFRLAAKENQLKGGIPLKQMKRLIKVLDSEQGEVLIDVLFSIGIDSVVKMTGQISSEVRLICQRCMGELKLPIKLDVQLGFVKTEAEMERLPAQYDANLIEQTPVMLADIIEDELLLALPPFPKHLSGGCTEKTIETDYSQMAEETNTESVKQENPFNILAKLKKD